MHVVVRGLDTGHVSLKGWWAALRKELATALVMAAAAGSILGTIGMIWSRHIPFEIIVGSAMTVSMVTAGFMGTVFPLVTKRIGLDPATTAGPFETAVQDVVGFALFLWLASQLLRFLR